MYIHIFAYSISALYYVVINSQLVTHKTSHIQHNTTSRVIILFYYKQPGNIATSY